MLFFNRFQCCPPSETHRYTPKMKRVAVRQLLLFKNLNLNLNLYFKRSLFLDFRYTEDFLDTPLMSGPQTDGGHDSGEEELPQIPKKVVQLNVLFQKVLHKFKVLCWPKESNCKFRVAHTGNQYQFRFLFLFIFISVGVKVTVCV